MVYLYCTIHINMEAQISETVKENDVAILIRDALVGGERETINLSEIPHIDIK